MKFSCVRCRQGRQAADRQGRFGVQSWCGQLCPLSSPSHIRRSWRSLLTAFSNAGVGEEGDLARVGGVRRTVPPRFDFEVMRAFLARRRAAWPCPQAFTVSALATSGTSPQRARYLPCLHYRKLTPSRPTLKRCWAPRWQPAAVASRGRCRAQQTRFETRGLRQPLFRESLLTA